jgi:hypothetical protein
LISNALTHRCGSAHFVCVILTWLFQIITIMITGDSLVTSHGG